MFLVPTDQSFYTIDVPPDPEPMTTQEKVMARLQMKLPIFIDTTDLP